jgi:hypothetical protein
MIPINSIISLVLPGVKAVITIPTAKVTIPRVLNKITETGEGETCECTFKPEFKSKVIFSVWLEQMALSEIGLSGDLSVICDINPPSPIKINLIDFINRYLCRLQDGESNQLNEMT